MSDLHSTGGTSSCLIASRLADADPTLRILVVEAGPHTQENLAHVQPARYLHHLAPDSKTVTFVVANPEKELGGRQTIVPCGHCVGGGSSVNCKRSTAELLSTISFTDETGQSRCTLAPPRQTMMTGRRRSTIQAGEPIILFLLSRRYVIAYLITSFLVCKHDPVDRDVRGEAWTASQPRLLRPFKGVLRRCIHKHWQRFLGSRC